MSSLGPQTARIRQPRRDCGKRSAMPIASNCSSTSARVSVAWKDLAGRARFDNRQHIPTSSASAPARVWFTAGREGEGASITALAAEDAVVGLLGALGRVGERSSAEIARGHGKLFFGRATSLSRCRARSCSTVCAPRAVTLLDVRPEDEFAHGHLAGAPQCSVGAVGAPAGGIACGARGLSPTAAVPGASSPSRRSRCCGAGAIRCGGSRMAFPEWKVAGLPVESARMG